LILTLSLLGTGWAGEDPLCRNNADNLRRDFADLPQGITVALDANDPAEGSGSIRVTHQGHGAVSVTLVEVPTPRLEARSIQYTASIRAEGVKGKAYLEMWCVFGGKEAYFSRALNDTVSGTAPWKRVSTPFFFQEEDRPSSVRLGVRLEGPGTVWVDDLELREAGKLGNHILIGSLLGAGIGVLGALIGVLGGVLAPKGKARKLVLGITGLCPFFCAALLIIGLVRLTGGEPYGAWYPFVLAGGIGTILFTIAFFAIRHRYLEAESRRLAAMDMMP
jgi:hypothetical protein